ncbi:LysR substrate-binding domain-containing protein, partial [Pseudomonas aeruginosa]
RQVHLGQRQLQSLDQARATYRENLRAKQPLRFAVLDAFAAYWLMPSLPRFHQAHPHLDVSLVTSERGLAGQRGDIDVAILFGDGRSKHGEAHRLFREEVFPVCSPRLVEGLQLPLATVHL